MERPSEVPMSRGAGRGAHLLVQVRLDEGREFPCLLDTGAPLSFMPEAVEDSLGKRLGTFRYHTLDTRNHRGWLYAAPKLYLGHSPLLIGNRVGTRPGSIGILGMDCLRHYCVQLDFEACQVRFLDPESANETDLGWAFPLLPSPYAMIGHGGLFGEKNANLLVDTGCTLDGYLPSRLFERKVRELKARSVPVMEGNLVEGVPREFALFPEGRWGDETYANLVVGSGRGSPHLIGLRFLARHQVTFNFPKGVMYLKRTSRDAASSPTPPGAKPVLY